MAGMADEALGDRIRRFFAARAPEVIAVYLFGSEARGRATPRSDIDLGVLFGREVGDGLDAEDRRLEDDLVRDLGREVDLIALDTAPPDLVHRVMRDGIILHESDRAARIRFEVKARNEYWDLLPILEQYRARALRP